MNPARKLRFRKSSKSGGPQNSCVEVAGAGKDRFIRDSKDKSGPVLQFKGEDFATFVSFVKRSG